MENRTCEKCIHYSDVSGVKGVCTAYGVPHDPDNNDILLVRYDRTVCGCDKDYYKESLKPYSYFTEKTCKPVYGVCRDPFCPNCFSTLARYEKGLFGRAIKVDDTMNYCGHCGAKVIR